MLNPAGMIRDLFLDHVAVAAERWADAWPRYAGDLAGEWVAGGAAPGFASAQVRYSNGMRLEVLAPHEPERNDFLRRFLDRSGPGPHHLTYKVKDLRAALAEAEASGYRPVGVDFRDPTWKEAFLHPKDAPGVVVQLAESYGDWESPPPPDFPQPRTVQPAELVHVTHAVASMADGERLFRGLLAGVELDRGENAAGRWIDLAWEGPGRVRLLEPAKDSAIAADLRDRRGRIDHLRFRCDAPQEVPCAASTSDGVFEVRPDDNLGMRLLLEARG
jgi:catechol 2,3-dioxygenase-like lactoylglutathione lyase family enzyme